MSQFWDFVRKSETTTPTLPLIHSTDLYRFRSICLENQLSPTECNVYKGESLLYFFYGRPSYRPHAGLQTVTARAFLPVCLVLSPNVDVNPTRIMPFDTGAFEHQMMHPPIHPEMRKDDFSIEPHINNVSKVVKTFYGRDKEYFLQTPRNRLELPYDEYEDLEIDAYFKLLHFRANTDSDDRVTAIEFQTTKNIMLNGKIDAVILPKQYLDTPLILTKIESWGAKPIAYHVGGEFVPREVQGAVFQRIADFFYDKGLFDGGS